MPVRTIAFTSGKGGVGKTSITANLGIAIAAQDNRVGVVDADLGLANLDVILKLKPKYNIEHVINGEKSLEEIFIKGPAGLVVIPASSGKLSLANLSNDYRAKLIRDLIQSTKDFDLLLIDTAAGMSQNVLEFGLIAHEIMVITTPEPTAITDAYAMIKVFSMLNGIAKNPQSATDIGLIVNMTNSANQAEEVAERIIMATRQFLSVKVNFMGYILKDSLVSDSVYSQQPLIFKYPESNAARCMNNIADRILANAKFSR
ncbi:P-loop NTPase [Candidatus Poribacteria bacterium]|nr:P-loop NTPase [Candidatus Poribacteria bacterium]